jgi:crotonobetainyl-CoA:carnitine CoA-transferase CaiB-like acyl-CoA transferase
VCSDSSPLRVIEVASWLAAPAAAALLGDMGAEVIKIEPPSGDPGRRFIQAMGASAPSTPSFSLLNRNKKSVVLDLSQDSGCAALQCLIATSDVFITNLRPNSLERWALEPKVLTERYPRLIVGSVTGMGLLGPDRNRATFDVGGFWARSGLMYQLTADDASPSSPTGGFGDLVTGLTLYAGIVTALLERERSGKGAVVQTSLLQAGMFMAGGDLAVQAAYGRVPGQSVRSETRTPLVNSYRSADGRWFFLTGVDAERQFPSVCRAIERCDLQQDARFASAREIRRHGRELVEIFDAAFLRLPLRQWAERFTREDVLWEPLATPEEALSDPQLEANGMVRPVHDGQGVFPMITSPFSLSTPLRDSSRAPTLGEHTDEVLGRLKVDPAK